jgi:hypothetical protein
VDYADAPGASELCPERPAPRPKEALLVYANTNNLGDEIQSIAVERFLSGIEARVDRDNLSRFMPAGREKYRIVLNGWYSGAPENWPPSEHLDPLLISMHISGTPAYRSGLRARDVLLCPPLAEYLRHYGPVGARDLSTLRLIQRAHVEGYFSGCVTLTLPRCLEDRDEESLVLNDLPPEVAASILARTRKRVVQTSHVGFHEPDSDKRFRRARELLDVYRRAGCVVTTRLHCALPTLAMGTPVLLIDVASDQHRFEGLHDLVHHCTVAEFLAGSARFDPDDPPPPLDRHFDLASALTDRIQRFIGSPAEKGSAHALSDRELLEGARHVQQLLVRGIERERRHRETVAAIHAKLFQALQSAPSPDHAGPLTESQRAGLVATRDAAAALKSTILIE